MDESSTPTGRPASGRPPPAADRARERLAELRAAAERGPRLALARCLDVRHARDFAGRPTLESANIPLGELAARVFELPAPGERINVADTGPEAAEGIVEVARLHRIPRLVDAGYGIPDARRYRLWTPPSFLVEAVAARAPASALCLACGTGREAIYLAALGWRVTAVDRLPDALARARLLEARYSPPEAPRVRWVEANLRAELTLPEGPFELVTQFYFADGGTSARLARHLAADGVAVLESLSWAHRARTGRPASPERVLKLEAWSDWRIVRSEAGHRFGKETLRLILRPRPEPEAPATSA